MLINGAIYWGVGFVTAWSLGLALGWGGRGIWTGLALALCTAAVVLSLRFRYIVGRHITGHA
jgi:MATE family multidrug resistance protein